MLYELSKNLNTKVQKLVRYVWMTTLLVGQRSNRLASRLYKDRDKLRPSLTSINKLQKWLKINYHFKNYTRASSSACLKPSPLVTKPRKYADQTIVPIQPSTVHNFDANKIPKEVTITKSEALELYKSMVLIRTMETKISNLYKEGKVTGSCHLCIGSEAVGTGIVANMIPVDNLITSYRSHAFTILLQNRKGNDGPLTVISELTGKSNGASAGKGGPMYVSPQFFGGEGIVGGQAPLGIGLGYGHVYTDDGGVAFVLYDDRAANQGQVFESFNIAALLKLPVVFICESNLFKTESAAKRFSSSMDYYKAGRVIPGIKVDGMDVITTKEIIKTAAKYSRAGNGPIIVQFDYYRHCGRSMSDPSISGHSGEEVDKFRETRDPITYMEGILLEACFATEEEVEEMNERVNRTCNEAKKKAEEAPVPDVKELYANIYQKYFERPRKRTCVE